jgi:hypothetical protein
MAMSGTSEDLDELVTALSARFEITIERELKWFLEYRRGPEPRQANYHVEPAALCYECTCTL